MVAREAMKDSDDYMDSFRRYKVYSSTVEAMGGIPDDYEEWKAEEAFKNKLREMRESGSIPSYMGPRAAK